MTTNQTIDGVPRELLEVVAGFVSSQADAFPLINVPRGLRSEALDQVSRELHALLDNTDAGISASLTAKVEPVAYRCRHSATEPWFFSDKPGYWEWQALYAEQPAPVAPSVNYGALDPVERLAVCRGEVAPVADAPNPDYKNQGESAPVMKSWRCDEPGTPGVWSKSKITSGSVALITEGPFRGQIVVLDHADSPKPFLIYRGAGQLATPPYVRMCDCNQGRLPCTCK